MAPAFRAQTSFIIRRCWHFWHTHRTSLGNFKCSWPTFEGNMSVYPETLAKQIWTSPRSPPAQSVALRVKLSWFSIENKTDRVRKQNRRVWKHAQCYSSAAEQYPNSTPPLCASTRWARVEFFASRCRGIGRGTEKKSSSGLSPGGKLYLLSGVNLRIVKSALFFRVWVAVDESGLTRPGQTECF